MRFWVRRPSRAELLADINLAAEFCPRLIGIRDGRILMDGSPEEVLQTERIEELTDAASVHGLTVTVFNDSTTVYSQAFGFANLAEERPLQIDTEFYGASLSKSVFAAENSRVLV